MALSEQVLWKKERSLMAEKVWQAFPVEEQIRIREIFSFFEMYYENGYEFSGETHNFWECLYVLEGEACFSSDESVYNLKQGDIIFHKPMSLHKFFVTGDAGARLLVFSFSAQGPLTLWLRDKVFALTVAQKEIVNAMLDYIQFLDVGEEAPQKEYKYLIPYNHIPNYLQMISTYYHQLFLMLAEEEIMSVASSAPDAKTFGKAISYLNSNLDRQPAVSEIARFCGVSEAGLKRAFRKYAGIGVHKYILKLKIKAAVELLQDGDNVSSVAEKVGFNSQSYFSKAFKRETGKNPSEIKENQRPEIT